MKSNEPLVSFGIPVRNGMGHIGKLIDSIFAQTLQDFEIIISDNDSTDGTKKYLKQLSSQDPRIRCIFNAENIGILENDNQVFRYSRGKYFKWNGVDDWLEPDFAAECVALMESDDSIIGVTTHTIMHYDDGSVRYTKYEGERLESPKPHRRFARLMWLLSKGILYYGPLLALYRRSALEETHLLQIIPDADLNFVAEISLVGRFAHINQNLVHKNRVAVAPSRRNEVYKRLHPVHFKEVRHSYRKSCQRIALMILSSPISHIHKLYCLISLIIFFLKKLPIEIARNMKLQLIKLLPEGSNLRNFLDRPKSKD